MRAEARVSVGGVEPPTWSISATCSDRLSYTDVVLWLPPDSNRPSLGFQPSAPPDLRLAAEACMPLLFATVARVPRGAFVQQFSPPAPRCAPGPANGYGREDRLRWDWRSAYGIRTRDLRCERPVFYLAKLTRCGCPAALRPGASREGSAVAGSLSRYEQEEASARQTAAGCVSYRLCRRGRQTRGDRGPHEERRGVRSASSEERCRLLLRGIGCYARQDDFLDMRAPHGSNSLASSGGRRRYALLLRAFNRFGWTAGGCGGLYMGSQADEAGLDGLGGGVWSYLPHCHLAVGLSGARESNAVIS